MVELVFGETTLWVKKNEKRIKSYLQLYKAKKFKSGKKQFKRIKFEYYIVFIKLIFFTS